MTVWEYLERRWPVVLDLTLEHLGIVVLSVVIATVLAAGLAALTYQNDAATSTLMTATNTLYTVPSLSYFTVLFPLVGLGLLPAVLVTVLYALLPIVRNALTGLREVDEAIVRAAKGMGMGRWQRLWRIDLPLAWPVILSGVRVATVLTAGIATIGAYVDGPGLGALLFEALKAVGSSRALPQASVAIAAIVLVALLLDSFLHHVVARYTTPRGLR
jgi:osmoprotectant transport system permease protein